MSKELLPVTQRTNARQNFPFPDEGRLVEENPPCLSWIQLPQHSTYTAVILSADGTEVWRGETEKNYIVPDRFFEPGSYRWNLFMDGKEKGEVSFTLAENAVRIHRVTARQLYDSVPSGHPRHLFFPEDKAKLIADRPEAVETLRRNIEQAYRDGLPERPMFHRDPNALPYREYFGRFRDYCDRDLVACALGYALLDDEQAGAYAKKLVLTICDWNPHGPCSLIGRWGDEIGLSCARCLPSVYDMLWPILDDKERNYVASTVRTYAEQCWIRLKKNDYCANPGDSHSGRIAAYMGEAALVLKDSGIQTEAEALAWLDYALDIYGGIFPHYGTPDGGWAEGTFYSSSYTRWYLPFFCAVERYSGCRFLDRPFYQRLTQFFLHFANPEFENHPFCDGYWCHPEDAEWPGFFAQNPCRLYADRFGPSLAVRRAREAASQPLYLLHLLDVFIPEGTPPEVCLTGEAENVRAFPDAGFVSMHTDLRDTPKDTAVLVRASRYGSDSHRHADQGSFAFYYKGTALISPSGYFGRRYGTGHHMQWTNATKAHNAILVDGVGQEVNSMNSVGRIVSCVDNGEQKIAVVDLTPAYPMLTCWRRTFVLRDRRLTVSDHVEADHPVVITYPLHTLSEPKPADGQDFTVERNGIRMTVHPLSGGLSGREITDRYDVGLNDGEPEAYHVTMPQQYHIRYTTPAAAVHDLTVEYTVG